jgi:aryl-alcohol dehydrogenase-like predicted oxidoreductase
MMQNTAAPDTFLRPLSGTDLTVSAIGLGTVKFGRNTGVNYPKAFSLPSDDSIKCLLALASELNINLLDTAPAYGSSEERLGKLLFNRHRWVLCTKVGEEFDGSQSTFDYSASHTRISVERSLNRLRTDYLDLVLIHSSGNDLDIMTQTDCVETLRKLQQQGLIRYIGMSTKTESGGELAAELMDVVMLTWNKQQQDRQTLQRALALQKGVLVKKGLSSGRIHGGLDLSESLSFVLKQKGINALVAGTINTDHLQLNVDTALEVLANL